MRSSPEEPFHPERPGRDEPARESTGGYADEPRPRKMRGWGWTLVVALVLVLLGIVGVKVYGAGVDAGVRQERAAIAASASALAARKPPPELECPTPGSDEALNKAIYNKPLLVISQSPTEAKTLVMRTGVVVVVEAKITRDLVVCGDDSAVVLKAPLGDGARISIDGGPNPKKSAEDSGPALYLVDGVAAPRDGSVWFGNGHPKIIRCYETSPQRDVRECGTYYRTAFPAPPSPTPSRPRPSRT